MSDVFGYPKPAEPSTEDTPSGVTTAAALAAFRDDLTAHGFGPDETRVLVRIAAHGEVARYGLTIDA